MEFYISGSFQSIEIPSHPYAFNMEQYLRMYGASGILKVDRIFSYKINKSFTTRLLTQRKNVQQHIRETFPESLIPEAEALLIGDRSGMSEEDAANYRKLGITHLFAISGLHVGLLVFIVRECLLRLKIRRENVDVLLIILLPLYAIIAGGAPSVWRAVIVTILVLLTIYGRLPMKLDSALAISAIGFMLYKPYVIFQPGFQLSYLAALSLILSSKILSRQSSKLKLSFLVTMISQLSLYPILLLHFYELSLSSFLVNLLYVPLYSVVILPMNLILLLLTSVAMPIAKLLFFLYVPFRALIDQGTVWLSAIPYQLWNPGRPASIALVLAVVGVVRFFTLYEVREKLSRCLPYVLIPTFLIQFLPYTESQLRVTYLDVGQGDSIVIELPYKRGVYMIDTGGTVSFGEKTWRSPTTPFEVGRKIVVPYLKGRGITEVDKLIISHAHIDHMGGAHEVVEDIRVKEIHIPKNSGDVEEMEKLVRAANDRKVSIMEMKDGNGWENNDFGFYYVGPQTEEYVGNDSSLALYMTTTGPSFLFTGDMEEAAERKFLTKYKFMDFKNPILKVGHHGSKTSSTDSFIKALQPKLAVISAGRNNRFGHPSKEVLETFQKYQVPVFVTADNGSITVLVEGEEFSVSVMQ
ncbi:DNA internalization-related competence protein ComEC/Rec2 [Sporosarcina ureilytica]|uniref:DNA internalization-related competence protein ComEC/Rec2 n=1 Tax=Sporosarcina ureilytica TaxID=298596 RepID=UPI000A703B1F|nr:DNA internalization-related competence protein ComEC/Rec2 [Sporosarcina ureilytica]